MLQDRFYFTLNDHVIFELHNMITFNRLLYRSGIFFLLFFIPLFVSGQNGEITGTIIDHKVKETLIGANIKIKGTITGVTTDLDGFFRLQVSPGSYAIEISFISYQSKTINNVKVISGKTTDLGKIELEEEATALGGVTVQERRKTDTQIALINTIKTNNIAVSGHPL